MPEITPRRVIAHPCDRRLAEHLAERFRCATTFSENWDASCIGFDGWWDEDELVEAQRMAPGWHQRKLVA